MKKILLFILCAILSTVCISCDNTVDTVDFTMYPITINYSGDFNLYGITRATANDMTVWIFDVFEDGTTNVKKQSPSDADYCHPTIKLAEGQHIIAIVASNSNSPVYDTQKHMIRWTGLQDVYYGKIHINVTGMLNTNINLERISTSVNIISDGYIPSNATIVKIEPTKWFDGLDYLSGLATSPHMTAFNFIIPQVNRGTTSYLSYTITSIAPSKDWTTDIKLSTLDTYSNVISSKSITNTPLKSNRTTRYTGTLFGISESGITITFDNTEQSVYNAGSF